MNRRGAINEAVGTSVEDGLQRGIAAVEMGNKAAAYEIFQEATARHPEVAELWVWMGGTAPNLDEAEAAFRRAQSLDPTNEEAILGLRWVSLRREGTTAEAQPVPETVSTLSGLQRASSLAPVAESTGTPSKEGRKPGTFMLLGDLEMPISVAITAAIVVILIVALIWYLLAR